MNDTNRNKTRLLILLIYLLEGFVWYVISRTLSYYLGTVLHIHPVFIGLVGSIGLLPLVLKVFLGPIVDKYNVPLFSNSKKSFLFIGILCNGIFLSIFGILDIVNFMILFVIIFFLQSFGFALIDVTVDAISVSLKKESEIDTKNEDLTIALFMFIGMMAGGFMGIIFSGLFSLNYSVGFMIVGLLSICFLPVLRLGIPKNDEKTAPVNFGRVKELLSNKKFRLAMIFMFLYNIDGGLLEFTLEPYLGNTFGVSITGIGVINMISFVSSLGGILILALFRKKLNKFKFIIFLSLYYAVFSLVMCILIFTRWITLDLFIITYVLMGLIGGFPIMIVYAITVDMSDASLKATSFVILAFLQNFGTLFGIAFGGFLNMGIIYLISAIILTVKTIPIHFLIKENEQE
ncbi:MAG: MFS transporter [Candidatus Helarchaeota archaeon]